jgi:hypothetical protein
MTQAQELRLELELKLGLEGKPRRRDLLVKAEY